SDASVFGAPSTIATTDRRTRRVKLAKSTSCHRRPISSPRRRPVKASSSKSGRCREDVRNTPSGASVVQSRTARAQERLSGRGTFSEAVGFPGTDFELCAGYRTASVEGIDTHKVSTDAGQSRFAESTGGVAGRSAYQIIQSGLGSVGVSARRMLHALADGETD